MTKREAVGFFGGSGADLARALGITRQAVSQWADELTQEQEDRVRGAALRLGLISGCRETAPAQDQSEAA